VFVVDDDIDVMSDHQLEWALATRFRPAEDIVVSTGLRAVPIDPSLNGQRAGSKAGFDLTRPFGEDRAGRWQIAQPPVAAGREVRAGAVLDALRDGPLSFLDLVNACGSRDGREIARELGLARSTGRVLLNEDGLYVRV
jgi:3-polyprenyl-4-hydroxybenzoate decarboxylase